LESSEWNKTKEARAILRNGISHAGDFGVDVMGYHPYSYFFTQLRKDCFRRLVDYYGILSLEDVLEEDKLLYSGKPPISSIEAKLNETYAKINESKQLCDAFQMEGMANFVQS